MGGRTAEFPKKIFLNQCITACRRLSGLIFQLLQNRFGICRGFQVDPEYMPGKEIEKDKPDRAVLRKWYN